MDKGTVSDTHVLSAFTFIHIQNVPSKFKQFKQFKHLKPKNETQSDKTNLPSFVPLGIAYMTLSLNAYKMVSVRNPLACGILMYGYTTQMTTLYDCISHDCLL